MTKYIIMAIIVSGCCTAFLRSLPFIVFKGERKMPVWLDKLGQILPSAIMAVLIIYCLKDVGDDFGRIGISKILAVIVVAITYKWKHNTFISIGAGTAFYMLMLYLL